MIRILMSRIVEMISFRESDPEVNPDQKALDLSLRVRVEIDLEKLPMLVRKSL